MERITRFRIGVVLLLLLLVMGFYATKLYQLQVVETGGQPSDNMTTFTTLTRVKAARGDLTDRNGNVLVGSRASYDLVINHFVLNNSDNRNNHIYQLVTLAKSMGVAWNDHFPMTAEAPYTYTIDSYSSTWRGYFQKYMGDMEIDSDISAPRLLERLRKYYRLPDDWSDDEARAVIGIRYELRLRGLAEELPNYVFLEDASDDVRSAVLELNVPGMQVEASVEREYYTEYAAHILGYTGKMTPEQWETYQDKGYSMDADVGQAGLEEALEEYLHGTDGQRIDVVTVDGTIIKSYYTVEPKAGDNVELTIDLRLQMAAEDALAERIAVLKAKDEGTTGQDVKGAAAVAIDTNTGEVLACASYPTYDLANLFEKWDEILEIPDNALYNRALDATYPPGSTFKPVSVITAIDSGLITSGTTIETKGIYTKYADEDFEPACLIYTFSGGNHGTINAIQALQYSCNYFFYELGDRMTDDLAAMDKTAKGMGLGEVTGVELPESVGHRAGPATKKLLYGDGVGWYKADQIMAAIGQSDHAFTPLQLCVYATTLANRGTRYKATFLKRVVASDYSELVLENSPQIVSTLKISDDAYAAYMEGMYRVCNTPEGSGWDVFNNFQVTVAGKTGTAEHGGGTGTSDNAAFICFAPYEKPEIAVSTYFEQGGYGGDSCSVAAKILTAYFADSVAAIENSTTYENSPN